MKINRFINNTFSLSIMQFINIIAPLFLVPYLSRILLVSEFGAVMVAFSTLQIGFVITDYGFSITANYQISNHRDDVNYINELISKIFSAKLILLPIALCVVIGVSFYPTYYEYKQIFLGSLFSMVAQAYQPNWIFEGLEQMKSYVIYMSLTKVVYVILALILVDKPGDGLWVLISWSISNTLGTMVALYMVRQLGYKIGFADFTNAVRELRDSAQFFWSRVAVSFYTSATSVLVGSAGLYQVAIFSTAQKGYQAGQAITSSITRALYPYMTKEKDWTGFLKVLFVITSILMIGAVVIGYFSKPLLVLVFGAEYEGGGDILEIMMITLLVNYLGVSFGYPALGAIDKIKWANISVMWGSLFFAVSATFLLLMGSINAMNVTILVLVTELIVLIFRLFVFLSAWYTKEQVAI